MASKSLFGAVEENFNTPPVKVKICGINSQEGVEVAAMLGANALGFLIGDERLSKTGNVIGHRISVRRAANLVKYVPSHVGSVLLIHVRSIDAVVDLVAAVRPTALQIQLDFGLEALSKLRDRFPDIKILKSVHISPESVESDIIGEASVLVHSESVDAILLDSRRSPLSKQTGGTGVIHDWKISAAVVDAVNPFPVVLAGGLRPENVRNAIVQVKPRAVDVMTGVETPKAKGIKDFEKVGAFIQAVRLGSLPSRARDEALVYRK
jgi:phosphoribosylanthranilate isomerase